MATLNINDISDVEIFEIEGIVKERPREIILQEHCSSMSIRDHEGDVIIIKSEEVALNLIKALRTAIELNWFK